MSRDQVDKTAADRDERRGDTPLSVILAAAGAGTWEVDLPTSRVHCDATWWATLGYDGPCEPLTTAGVHDLIHPDDRTRVVRRIRHHLDGATAEFECTLRMRRQDGTYQWRQERGRVIERAPDGAAVRVVGVGTSLSEQNRYPSDRHPWENVFEHTQTLGLVVTAVATDTILAVNDTFARQHGYSVDELIGQPIAMCVPDDVQPRLREAIAQANRDGYAVGELAHRRRDGSRFPALQEVAAVRNTQLEPVTRVGFVLDMSDRERTLAALRHSEERFRLVAAATNDVLWDWNVTDDQHWWSPNAELRFGYDPNAEPDIAAWTERLHPDDRGRIITSLAAALKGRDLSWAGEYRFRLSDGSYGHILDRGHVVRDERGTAIRMIGAMTDVTELKAAHRSLVDAHQRLREASREVHLAETRERVALARELHDEFGQLLTAAKLSASWLRAAPVAVMTPVLQAQHAEKTASLCEVLDLALNGIREVATQLRPPAIDQLGLPRAIEGLAAHVERHAGLPCTVTIDEATRATVFGPVEGAALYRIAQELVTNATRHAGASRVEVTMRTAGGYVHLDVRDDGRGFDAAAARKPGAWGLKGVRERTELLGGQVAIESGTGAGTNVHVSLPLGVPA